MPQQMPDTFYLFSSKLEKWIFRIFWYGRIDWIILSWLLLGTHGTRFRRRSYEFIVYGCYDAFHGVRENTRLRKIYFKTTIFNLDWFWNRASLVLKI